MNLRRSDMAQIGHGNTVIWGCIVVFTLCIMYSSNLILNSYQQACHSSPHHHKLRNSSHNQLTDNSSHLQLTNSTTGPLKLSPEKEKHKKKEDRTTLVPFLKKPKRFDTQIKHLYFGIGASSGLWEQRKEYIKIWWRPKETRGIVWVDQEVNVNKGEGLPEVRVSGDTSKFPYANKHGGRSALRISRIVSEILRLGVEDVRWFVMGDDDTIFMLENLVTMLSKYDHRQPYYIGSQSESHIQNIFFSYAMAYGGGGFAISYPLAVELEKMQDRCMMRYPSLYGSDDRIQACMAEIGVPLTKDVGFHQYDVYGDLLGLLAAHPITPLLSLHHLDVVEPIFPGVSRADAIRHLFESVKVDPASVMQQSICYDETRFWSISISWGFVVQIFRGIISPRELERPTRTFLNWYRHKDYIAYAFNTRPVARNPCEKPFVFYMSSVRVIPDSNQTLSFYTQHKSPHPFCRWRMESPEQIETVVVLKKPDPLRWHRAPRRDCCRVLPSDKNATEMYVSVENCSNNQIAEIKMQKGKSS